MIHPTSMEPAGDSQNHYSITVLDNDSRRYRQSGLPDWLQDSTAHAEGLDDLLRSQMGTYIQDNCTRITDEVRPAHERAAALLARLTGRTPQVSVYMCDANPQYPNSLALLVQPGNVVLLQNSVIGQVSQEHNLSDGQISKFRETLLVHEMAHSIGSIAARIVMIKGEPGEQVRVLAYRNLQKFSVQDKGERRFNYFLEEGFAEWAAAQYRLENWGKGKDYNSKVISTPHAKMYGTFLMSVGVNECEGPGAQSYAILQPPAYAAQAFDVLATAFDPDDTSQFVTVFLQARDGDADAQRELIRYIESLQPGLYKIIRDTQYDTDCIPSFGGVLRAVIEATNRADLQQE